MVRQSCLSDDRGLAADLTDVEYGYDASDSIQLERKGGMRKRGLAKVVFVTVITDFPSPSG